MIRDADETLEPHLGLILVGDAHIVRRPGDAAREVGDLNRRLPVHVALHVPVQHLRLGVRKRRVEHVQLVGMREKLELDA